MDIRKIDRRAFLKASVLAAGAVTVSKGLASTKSWASTPATLNTAGLNTSIEGITGHETNEYFKYGIASGDPQHNSVILWTHVWPDFGYQDYREISTEYLYDMDVYFEVALDIQFKAVTHNGTAKAKPKHDYTVKIDVQNLEPDTRYFYRFQVKGMTSPTGVTQTLPVNTDEVNFAVVSCSNYPAGYFNVYKEVANYARTDEKGIDALLHLGDYIYEYDKAGYATDEAKKLGRELPENNADELLFLNDYRRRYAHYRSDEDLRACHAIAPWINVWDDHEIANDTYKTGAQNHTPPLGQSDKLREPQKPWHEGDFVLRRERAVQAYFEWLPIRPVSTEKNSLKIYRNFKFGDLVSLYMLDTRVIGRDKPGRGTFGHLFAMLFGGQLKPANDLLGREQEFWLARATDRSSECQWHVLGQQVLMGKMNIPQEVFGVAAGVFLGLDKTQDINTLVSLYKRHKQDPNSLNWYEKYRVTNKRPYNPDAWDGYPQARENLYKLFKGKNVVALAGDTHNAWASNLTNDKNEIVGVEFATASVSSPGLEKYLGGATKPSVLADGFVGVADDLIYANIKDRGFMITSFTREEAKSTWYYVSTVKDRRYDLIKGPTLVSGAGMQQLRPEIK